MKKIVKRIICMMVLVTIVLCDVRYNVWAIETNYGEKTEYTDKKEREFKQKYNEKERREILKEANKKIEDNIVLTEDEVEALNWQYDELEIMFPNEEVVWDIDHEKNIGVNQDVMLMSTAVDDSLVIGEKTKVEDVGNMGSKMSSKYYSDGEGGTYNFLNKLSSSFIVPGMKKTTLGNTTCYGMIPQGIVCCGGYFFVTAYCGSHSGHNSVIYVVNAYTKEYITTLVMDEQSHVGGIVYANGYLWICDTIEIEDGDSDATNNNYKGYLTYYNYSQIKEAINKIESNTKYTAVDMSYLDHGKVYLGLNNKASFITVYDGYLCVGEFEEASDNKGELNFYNPKTLLTGIVNKMTAATLPKQTQGALFYTISNQRYLILNASYGRNNNSTIHVYKVVYNSNAHTISVSRTKKIVTPPMLEEAALYGNQVYFVYESCGRKYATNGDGKGYAHIVIGKVCGFTTTFIFK